jgi:hypothetical protein
MRSPRTCIPMRNNALLAHLCGGAWLWGSMPCVSPEFSSFAERSTHACWCLSVRQCFESA